jgi:transposase-like protein/IS1 family transposase
MLCQLCQEEAQKSGWNRSGSQRYYCGDCRRYFTDGSTLAKDRRRVAPEKMSMILSFLLEGMSIRALERRLGVHRDTIIANMVEAGESCRAFLTKAIHGVQVDDVQADEIWAFCGMKEKTRVRLNRDETVGDIWCFTAMERTTKLILTFHVGKRTPIDTAVFADNLYFATSGRFQLTTDGFKPYLTAIPAILGGRVDYATLVKVYGNAPEERGYSPGKVIDIIETIQTGEPDEDRICTSHVERSNKTLRMGIRRLTRLTDAHSKKWENHEAMMALFIAYYNFVRVHSTIKTTPAKASGLTTEPWTLERLLSEASVV